MGQLTEIMNKRKPFSIIRSRHVTEKAVTLSELASNESNPSVRACKSPKAVFLVDPQATKADIKWAIEEIYREKKVTVVKVNTITGKRKPRRVRGRRGLKAGYKKAVVTFEPGDEIENI